MKWILGIVLALALAACTVPVVDTPPADVPVTGITISIAAQTLPPGTQYTLSATVAPATATDKVVTWSSSAPGVASVSSGLVQALTDGAATIIVTTHDGGFTATCAVTVQTQVIPPPAGLTGPVKAALYDGTTVRLWDGTNTVDWKTGVARHGNGRKISVGQMLYFLDANGAITQAINLPALPAGVTVIGDPVVWTFELITNAEAFALDYTPPASGGNYTRIWQDGAEFEDWHDHSWTYVSSFTAANGDIIVVDNIAPGRFHDISRPSLLFGNIIWAIDAGPIFYMPDMGQSNNITVYDAAGSHAVVITGGGFPWWGGTPWVQLGSTWYDGYGDVWDSSALTFATHANVLQRFGTGISNVVSDGGFVYHDAGQYPLMLQAYTDAASVYFVECVSGALVSFTPQTNAAAVVSFAYQGDGYRSTGAGLAQTLHPQLLDGSLYYNQAGTLWRMDTVTTIVSAFSADQQMWVMR